MTENISKNIAKICIKPKKYKNKEYQFSDKFPSELTGTSGSITKRYELKFVIDSKTFDYIKDKGLKVGLFSNSEDGLKSVEDGLKFDGINALNPVFKGNLVELFTPPFSFNKVSGYSKPRRTQFILIMTDGNNSILFQSTPFKLLAGYLKRERNFWDSTLQKYNSYNSELDTLSPTMFFSGYIPNEFEKDPLPEITDLTKGNNYFKL